MRFIWINKAKHLWIWCHVAWFAHRCVNVRLVWGMEDLYDFEAVVVEHEKQKHESLHTMLKCHRVTREAMRTTKQRQSMAHSIIIGTLSNDFDLKSSQINNFLPSCPWSGKFSLSTWLVCHTSRCIKLFIVALTAISMFCLLGSK